MTFGAIEPGQVGTYVGGVLLGVGIWWNGRKANRAERKVESRTGAVDERLDKVDAKANNATAIAANAQRVAAEMQSIKTSNDDLRQSLKDIRYDLDRCLKRDEANRVELERFRQSKVASDLRIHDLEREVVLFVAQVTQLTATIKTMEK